MSKKEIANSFIVLFMVGVAILAAMLLGIGAAFILFSGFWFGLAIER